MYNPSDIFGSLISDTEHLFDELQSHRSLDRNVHESPTPSIPLSPEKDAVKQIAHVNKATVTPSGSNQSEK